jgi:hypothetical protein
MKPGLVKMHIPAYCARQHRLSVRYITQMFEIRSKGAQILAVAGQMDWLGQG